MTALVLLAVIGSGVWVGFDAQTRDFTNHSFAKSTTAWVAGTILLWIVVFPMYLIARGKVPLASTPDAVRPLYDDNASASAVSPGGMTTKSKYVILATVAAFFAIYLSGSLDRPLSSVGLNYHECGTNAFGATFCGDQLDEYNQKLEAVKREAQQAANSAKADLDRMSQQAADEAAAAQTDLAQQAEDAQSDLDDLMDQAQNEADAAAAAYDDGSSP